MKLAALYNVYDGEELLEGSIRSIRNNVDSIIAIVQRVSNFDEVYEGGVKECQRLKDLGLIDKIILYESKGELNKRNFALETIKNLDYTHYMHIDTDEFYKREEFTKAKQFLISNPEYDGSVCKMKTFFKKPTWTIGIDNYYVPFIHKLKPNSSMGNDSYPYYSDNTRRSYGITKVHEFPSSEILMYHYSWVRTNIDRKANNSTAKNLILSSTLVQDYNLAKLGGFVNHYKAYLTEEPNWFDITIGLDVQNNSLPESLLVHLHLYNWDLYDNIKNYMKNITVAYDLYVTLAINSEADKLEREKQVSVIHTDFPNANCLFVKNVGADTVAFLDLLQYLKCHNKITYKYLLKLHTKSDSTWRKELIDPLLSSKDKFSKCLDLLRMDAIGMIGAQKWIRHEARVFWEMAGAYDLLGIAKMKAGENALFIGGTMFLCKFSPMIEWAKKVDIDHIIEKKFRGQHPNIKFIDLAYIIERFLGLLMLAYNLNVIGVI